MALQCKKCGYTLKKSGDITDALQYGMYIHRGSPKVHRELSGITETLKALGRTVNIGTIANPFNKFKIPCQDCGAVSWEDVHIKN